MLVRLHRSAKKYKLIMSKWQQIQEVYCVWDIDQLKPLSANMVPY